jgi:hypothetical protein
VASDLTTAGNFLQAVASRAKAMKGLPPVEHWNPPYCGEIDMVIRRDGSWTYMGTPIGRPALVRLFSTILRREEDGSYVLVTPAERVGIRVEDAPFLAVLMSADGAGRDQVLRFTTNLADEAVAGREHPLRFVVDSESGEVASYVHVRARLEARLNRPVYYQLVEFGVDENMAVIPDAMRHEMPLRRSGIYWADPVSAQQRSAPQRARDDGTMFGVWSGGVFFPMIASEALE